MHVACHWCVRQLQGRRVCAWTREHAALPCGRCGACPFYPPEGLCFVLYQPWGHSDLAAAGCGLQTGVAEKGPGQTNRTAASSPEQAPRLFLQSSCLSEACVRAWRPRMTHPSADLDTLLLPQSMHSADSRALEPRLQAAVHFLLQHV